MVGRSVPDLELFVSFCEGVVFHYGINYMFIGGYNVHRVSPWSDKSDK